MKDAVLVGIGVAAWGTGSALALEPAQVPLVWGSLIGAASFIGGVAMSSVRAGREWGRLDGRFQALDESIARVEQDGQGARDVLDLIREELKQLALAVREIQVEVKNHRWRR